MEQEGKLEPSFVSTGKDFTQKYWHFQLYRKLCKSHPLLAKAFTAMGSRADILVCCCFSPAADGGLLWCSYSRHVVMFFFATTKTTIPKLLILKLLLLETAVALPLNQVLPLLMQEDFQHRLAKNKNKKMFQFLKSTEKENH